MSHTPALATSALRRRWTSTPTWLHLRSACPDLRRGLQLNLALIWLLDAALQYQPYMFSAHFANNTLAPAAHGNPAVVANSIAWAAGVMGRHAVAYNAIFATIQLIIAAGLLHPRTTKPALTASIGWALGVWWFGEGFGGVLSGSSPLQGAPGAVVLYAFLAVLVWPTFRQPVAAGTVAESGLAGRLGARAGWVLLWSALAYMFLLPSANRAPMAAAAMIAGMGSGQPAPLDSMAHDLARLLAGQGLDLAGSAAVACALVTASIFGPAAARRLGVGLAAAVGLAIWVAQNLGEIFTGRGTDPNSGLLLVLVAVAFWPLRAQSTPRPDERRKEGRLESTRRDGPSANRGLGLPPAGRLGHANPQTLLALYVQADRDAARH